MLPGVTQKDGLLQRFSRVFAAGVSQIEFRLNDHRVPIVCQRQQARIRRDDFRVARGPQPVSLRSDGVGEDVIDLVFKCAHGDAIAPAPFRSGNVCEYNVKISVVGKNEALLYKRSFSFGGLLFPQASYTGLKKVFDFLHDSDNHTITLKQSAGPGQ